MKINYFIHEKENILYINKISSEFNYVLNENNLIYFYIIQEYIILYI